MSQFAKVFNFPTGQLLVMTHYNPKVDRDNIVFRSDIAGVQLEQCLMFPEDERADEVFKAIDEKQALLTFTRLQNMGANSSTELAEPATTLFNLAVQVENMRSGQKGYFAMIAKAKKTKSPEDYEAAKKILRISKMIEVAVDDTIKQILTPVKEAIS